MSRFAPALALLALACTPQSAVLTESEMVAYLSETTSFTLIKGDFKIDEIPEEDRWNIDCREFENEVDEALRLPDPLDICGGNQWPPAEEVWLDQGAYQAFRMDLSADEGDPEEVEGTWRGEGIMLNEGDLQVGFHNRVAGGQDFRFLFTIDPDFAPEECVQQDDGSVASDFVDGADWVAEWSKDIDWLNEQDDLPPFLAEAAARNTGGRLYYLNARALQFDPTSDDDSDRPQWSIPEEWRAGFAQATFVDEDFRSRYNRFGTPALYTVFEGLDGAIGIPADLLYWTECPEGSDIQSCDAYREKRNEVRGTAEAVERQIARSTPENEPYYRPIVHDNAWRPIDGRAPGMDAWVEIGYSWVMLDATSNPELGGSVKGSFSIVFDGNDSQSRLIVQGHFEIPKIKGEKWGAPDLRAEKAEENGFVPCGGN